MKEEIRVGVEFLRQFLAKYGQRLTQAQIDTFASKLTTLLESRYQSHWYDKQPMKGQAFRCLRLKGSENYMDPVLERILADTNLKLNQLGLPSDFTLWIDPGEVSVRFGDQVGYTYTIARLNTKSGENDDDDDETAAKANRSQLECDLKAVKEVTAIAESVGDGHEPTTTPKSALIVENSAKIFDEKLTAFIRQNSCRNNAVCSSSGVNEENLDDDFMSNDLIDRLITLSAEKRTISPPSAASTPSPSSIKPSIIRTNSSSIDINPTNSQPQMHQHQQQPQHQHTKSRMDSKKLSSQIFSNNTNNRNSILNSSQNQSNRLSYNDSCYYSSSSSSCSSSLGSTHDDNYLAHLNWFKQDQQQQQQNQSSLISKTTPLYETKEDEVNRGDSFQNQFLFKPSSFYGKWNIFFISR